MSDTQHFAPGRVPSSDAAAGKSPPPDAGSLATVALEAAEAAAHVHLRHLHQVRLTDATPKGRHDYVSLVDLEAQEAALAVIESRLPGSRILAEEGADVGAGGGVPVASPGAGAGPGGGAGPGVPIWVVDPLDGTRNFLHGHPAFCASVGVVMDGVAVAGAVVVPVSGERFVGWKGGGAWRNERPIRVSPATDLGLGLVATGFPFKRPEEIPSYLGELARMLRASGGIRREGAAALDLCRLAQGVFEGFWEGWLAPWDVAGGLAILSEAGGCWSGARLPDGSAPHRVLEGGPIRAACSEAMLEAIHEVLGGVD
jgi:myo-inositol-1(or 4)-monophosphatase